MVLVLVQHSLQHFDVVWHEDQQAAAHPPDFLSQTLEHAVVACVTDLFEQIQVLVGAATEILGLCSVQKHFTDRNLQYCSQRNEARVTQNDYTEIIGVPWAACGCMGCLWVSGRLSMVWCCVHGVHMFALVFVVEAHAVKGRYSTHVPVMQTSGLGAVLVLYCEV